MSYAKDDADDPTPAKIFEEQIHFIRANCHPHYDTKIQLPSLTTNGGP
jgi:hypothetical protein